MIITKIKITMINVRRLYMCDLGYQRDQPTHLLCQHHVDAIARAVDGHIYMFFGK